MSLCCRDQIRIVPLLLGLGFAGVAYPPSLCAEIYSLLVGVNNCPDFRLAGGIKPRPLRGAESDALQIAQLLTDQFGVSAEHLNLLMGDQATLAAVRKAWHKIDAQLKGRDQVVFYFAGHGTQVKDQMPLDEEDDGLDEALCLADTTVEGENLLVDDELARWFEETTAGKITVILDCCHAGTGTKDIDDIAPRYLPIIPSETLHKELKPPWRDLRGSTKSLDKQVTALFACQPNQQAYERRVAGQKAPQRSGQFTHYLLAGLKENQAVTAEKLVIFVRRQLDQSFNQGRPHSGEKQEPDLDGSPRLPVLSNGRR